MMKLYTLVAAGILAFAGAHSAGPVLAQQVTATAMDTPAQGGSGVAQRAPGRLKELDDKKLAPGAKAKLGLRLYREEMLRPTPRPQAQPGKPADPRTHDWVLARL